MKKAKAMRGISRNELMREEPLSSSGRRIIGSMQMFFYDPKHKETLPYYDKVSFVNYIKTRKGGFLGLNLHYLPPILH